MRRKQKAKTASLSADDCFYQPSWIAALIALALAAMLTWHGQARADEFTPPESANLPDSIHGPGSDRLPPARGCSDAMDVSPEETMRATYDVDLVSMRSPSALARTAANNDCRNGRPERPAKA